MVTRSKSSTGLLSKAVERLAKPYASRFGLRAIPMQMNGTVAPDSPHAQVLNRPILSRARAEALQEAVRWGEPNVFFLAPGAIGWIVAVADQETILGGVFGGVVFPQEDPLDVPALITYLAEAGCSAQRARQFVRSVPLWPHARVREAADVLQRWMYTQTGLCPLILDRHRERAQQQRQIAETIHQDKRVSALTYSLEDERALFSLIRVGDRPGARRILNKSLARMFLDCPRITMVQARAIEMMGYLVRLAIEDNPIQEALLARHGAWLRRILSAHEFETLCWAVREILDDFMEAIFLQGYNRSNRKVHAILDYIAGHYTERLSLEQVAGAARLSSYRVAHLVKEVTGKTVSQHIRQLRIRKAQELLLHTEQSYAEVAYSLGFADQSHFTKQFREATGITPARFRGGR